jgi:tetratricopeptide (TPR) repeat protein
LQDPEPLVRVAAIRNYDNVQMEDAQQVRQVGEELRSLLAPLLNDPVRAVRAEAAHVLAQAPRELLSPGERQSFDQALDEFIATQMAIADRPEAHFNLARLHEKLGQWDQAVAAYHKSSQIDPLFAAPKLNLAALFDRQAEQAAYEQSPATAEAKQQAARKLREEGTKLLARDIGFAPQSAPLRHRYGLALYLLGRLDEAEAALAEASRLDPNSAESLLMLTLLYERREKWPQALEHAERLVKLRPQDAQFRQVYENIRAAVGQQKIGPAPPPRS